MFSRAFKLFKNFKPLLAATLLTTGLGFKKVFLDQKQEINLPQTTFDEVAKHPLRKIIEKQVCDSKSIKQGQLYFVQVTQQQIEGRQPKKYTVVISRVRGKLYAVVGHCTYQQPLSDESVQSNKFTDAISFNQKLYCPHHGCAFDIRTGTVQYGPAKDNLAKIFVSQVEGKVRIAHPAIIPISVEPKFQFRDFNDLRKVVIVGGDHNATMGVIQGLKLYGYGGQLTIVDSLGDMSFPFRDDLLHKKILNLKKENKKLLSQKQLQKELNKNLYQKLNFHPQLWYKQFGIQFLFSNQLFRVFNKKYFPYVKFEDGSKVEFDGIVYCTGFRPKFPYIKNITSCKSETEYQIDVSINDRLELPPNVFAPFYNKQQHMRMLKFLNTKSINNLVVMGMNVQSLQFVQALKKQFPQIGVKIIDMNKQNTLTEMLGPEIGHQIIRQYTKRGVDMYIKVQDMPQFTNTYTNQKLAQKSIYKKAVVPKNSIQIKMDEQNKLVTDCMVLFPNNVRGNSDKIKTAKFVDIDFNKINDRIVTDPNCRTDTKRMFAAGSGSSMEYFFTRDRIQLINPNVSHEQGLTSGYNLDARNVPFHYIPFEKHEFFDKKILYAGARKPFNEMFVIGDIKEWDFIAFYALENEILGVSASPSRQRQFQVIRESFRLQCSPELKGLVKGQWDILNIYKLIRKLNKSGCYKQLIQDLHAQMNIPDVIWMNRQNGSNVKDDDDESAIQYDSRGYEKEA